MSRQPMLGALVAAAAIALVQCGRTIVPMAPQDRPPSAAPPPSPDGSHGDTPVRSVQPSGWLDELELNPPPAHGPAPQVQPQKASPPAPERPAPPGGVGQPESSSAQSGAR